MTGLMNAAHRLSQRMRARRFERFRALISGLDKPLRILDVGGTNGFWEAAGYAGSEELQVTLLNLTAEERKHSNIETRAGSATDLEPYADGTYDVVFSNSVIEHLFTLEDQLRMAQQIQRVAPSYWVQTPNYWFPVEPHFHFVGWQWLPVAARVAILRRKRCGWRGRTPDPVRARELVTEVRLMTRSELARAFPGARLEAERFAGLVKSWIAIGGFERTASRA